MNPRELEQLANALTETLIIMEEEPWYDSVPSAKENCLACQQVLNYSQKVGLEESVEWMFTNTILETPTWLHFLFHITLRKWKRKISTTFFFPVHRLLGARWLTCKNETIKIICYSLYTPFPTMDSSSHCHHDNNKIWPYVLLDLTCFLFCDP